MKKIKSFVYLDNQKMYSISSQIFEGLTEFIVESEKNSDSNEASQKGVVGSGRLMANIIEIESSRTEKKFLHDFSYTLFEEKLAAEGRILEVSDENIKEVIGKIGNYSFIKISGNVIFNDLKIIENTVKNFNNLGEALGYITHSAEHKSEVDKLKEQVKSIKNPDQKARANAMIKSAGNFNKVLKEKGLHYDEVFLKHLAYVLDYGYNQQFEVQMPFTSNDDSYHLFSAQLKRENLKEDEYSIIKKYSREAERNFQLFGIITQKLDSEEKRLKFANFKEIQETRTDKGMKEALMDLVFGLTNVEGTFTGKLDYEFIVDPIAMYIEI